MVVEAEEEVEAAEVREEIVGMVEALVVVVSLETPPTTATTPQSVGRMFNVTLINLHFRAVKNISVLAKVLIGVKSQGLALGKTTGLQRILIEKLTSLNLID